MALQDLTSRRRFLRFTVLGAMGTAVLAACGGPATTPTPPPKPTEAPKPAEATKPAAQPTAAPTKPAAEATKPAAQPTAAPAKAAAGQIEMNWFLPLSAAPEIKIWEDFVGRFQKANPNITIKGSYEPWNDYWTKLQTVMAGGAIPDVIWLHYTRIAEWASKDVVKPLDDLLVADKIDPKEFVFIEGFKYKGKIYGAPKDNGITMDWFNADMYNKAGVPLPTKNTTYDKALEGWKILTVDASGKNSTESGFNPNRIAQWGTAQLQTSPRGEGLWTWFKSMGGKLYDADMKQSLINDPDSVAAIQWVADLQAKWKVAPLPGAITDPGDPFRIGKVANGYTHHAMAFFLHDEKRTFKWDEMYYPQGKGGLVISGGATGFSIPKATKHPDEAWVLTKFMTGEEQQKIIIEQRRWASGLTKLVPIQYQEGYHTPNYLMCHVDPLTGKGPQAEPAPSPAPLAEIEQVWNTAFDPVWLGKAQAKDVVKDLKAKIDELLQRPTKI